MAGRCGTYAQNLATKLVARRHEVTVVCANDPQPTGVSEEDGVVVRRLRLLARLYGTPIISGLLKELKQLDAEIIHANFPSPYIAYNAARASAKKHIPAILTWHNDLPAVTVGATILIETHDHLVLPRYIRTYWRVISTSQTYANNSRILPKLGALVTVVPNGVDCAKFNPENDGRDIRNRYGLGGKFTLLLVGALTKWHGYRA